MAAAHLRAPSVAVAAPAAHVRGCTGKLGYETQGMARHAGKMKARRYRMGSSYCYACKACGSWHLSRQAEA